MIASTSDLTNWITQSSTPRRRRGVRPTASIGLRFAFYGRTSTTRYQDRCSSRQWQFDSAADLIRGHGRVVAEFFDIGYSRRLAWAHRPEAADLLAAITSPDRGFDAIVVGEYERAFYGDQIRHLAPTLARHGVQLWLPEAHGPIDLDDPTHRALPMLLGAHSRREVLPVRFYVLGHANPSTGGARLAQPGPKWRWPAHSSGR